MYIPKEQYKMITDSFDKRLKLLMTTDTVGGVWVYSLTLARALAGYGVEVLLATMGAKLSDYQKRQLAELPNVRWFESEYKLEWMDKPWDDVDRAGEWLMELAGEFEPDLVHLNDYSHGVLEWPCPCLLVGHSCVYSWFRDVMKVLPAAEWNEYYTRVSAGLANADIVTAPSRYLLNTLKKIYGPFTAAGPIYNSSDLAFAPSPRKEPFVFSAGRLWDAAKNISLLERAAPNANCDIYVAGNSRNPVDGTVVNASNVHHLGFLSREQMNLWLTRAAVYALPAKYEPFGLSALEAAMAGCALVLGDIPSLREIWGDTAVFVNPEDDKQIAEVINELIDNEKRRRLYAKRAQLQAELYSTARMAQGYMNLYGNLLSRSAVPVTLVEREAR